MNAKELRDLQYRLGKSLYEKVAVYKGTSRSQFQGENRFLYAALCQSGVREEVFQAIGLPRQSGRRLKRKVQEAAE